LVIRRALLIANPASRRGRGLIAAAKRAFERRGVACDVVLTEYAGHAAEIAAAQHEKYDAVFSLGGDGTAMEVAGALADTGYLVGALPGGTGNLLARALGTPLGVDRAVGALVGGVERRIDLGRLGDGRRFAIAAGVGIDVSMVQQTPKWMKKFFGVAAYAVMGSVAAIRILMRRELIQATVTVDGVAESGAATTIMVANFGALLNERITLGPEIQSDDGVLDVCVFSPRSLWDAIRIMWRLLRRDFSSHPAMRYRRGSRIRVETEPPCEAQADGELIGMTPLDIVVEPLSVRLLVPKTGVR
jgi:YegS/Rv2252/BmrU family lipid kinase